MGSNERRCAAEFDAEQTWFKKPNSGIEQVTEIFLSPTAASALTETPKSERRQISWAPG